jgi:hypothetical protein
MSSATDRCDAAAKGCATGLALGLLMCLVVLVMGAALVHFCVLPWAPWCGW